MSSTLGVFIYGKAIKNLSDEVFTAWIEFLLDDADKSSVSIALNLCDHYYMREGPASALPSDLTFQMLTHPSLFEKSDENTFDTMTNYYWTENRKSIFTLKPRKKFRTR